MPKTTPKQKQTWILNAFHLTKIKDKKSLTKKKANFLP